MAVLNLSLISFVELFRFRGVWVISDPSPSAASLSPPLHNRSLLAPPTPDRTPSPDSPRPIRTQRILSAAELFSPAAVRFLVAERQLHPEQRLKAALQPANRVAPPEDRGPRLAWGSSCAPPFLPFGEGRAGRGRQRRASAPEAGGKIVFLFLFCDDATMQAGI